MCGKAKFLWNDGWLGDMNRCTWSSGISDWPRNMYTGTCFHLLKRDAIGRGVAVTVIGLGNMYTGTCFYLLKRDASVRGVAVTVIG